MKFYDNNGCERDSYLEMIGADVGISVKKLIDIISMPFKKEDSVDIDDIDEIPLDDTEFYDQQVNSDCITANDESMDINGNDVIIPERDDIFIPGVTPKIPYNPGHHITVDPTNSQLILHDEDGNILNVTRIDPRLDKSNIMDILNMVYDDLPAPEKSSKSKDSEEIKPIKND